MIKDYKLYDYIACSPKLAGFQLFCRYLINNATKESNIIS